MNIKTPTPDERLDPAHASEAVLTFLAQRRSGMVKCMGGDGPNKEQLDLILRLAARAPDHRKLFPWRFILFQGKVRAEFGEHLAAKFKQDCPNMDETRIAFEQGRFLRAPLVVGVVSSPKECSRGTPKWEQELSAGAVCQNMLLAARASGFSAQWLTEWYGFDPHIAKVLGLTNGERMAGFIYIGEQSETVPERTRPNLSDITSVWRDIKG
ncbi:MAG: nitroreductase [Robiginitomaculum sp.]|nr:nitroreductase [Robiginitomaculum sp.]